VSAAVPYERQRGFIAPAVDNAGMPAADALTVASLMAEADLQGSDGHGVIRLPQYLRRIRAGGINLRHTIRVERVRAGMALVDGDNALGHHVM
jgi:L-2-hydroxycarboxylate dehydrogenase (NAD+)